MRWWLVFSGLGTALLVGQWCCMPPGRSLTSIDVLADDVHEDEVAAMAKYQGEEVSVRGKVYKKGLKGVREAQGEQREPGNTSWTVQMGKQFYAYLLLGSENGGSGRVVCFFPPDALETLADVQEGDVVGAHCRFAGIGGKKKVRNPVLNTCVVER